MITQSESTRAWASEASAARMLKEALAPVALVGMQLAYFAAAALLMAGGRP